MPKVKTKRAAAKRFKVTGTGKLKRMKAYKSHILTKKTTKRKRTGKGCIAGAACRWNLQYVDPDRSSRECKTGAVYFHVYQ